PPGGLHSMRRPSRLHGIAAAGCRPEGHAVRTAELAHHAASAVRWLPGASHRHHASCPGDLESQETSQRNLREAHRTAAKYAQKPRTETEEKAYSSERAKEAVR